MPDMPNPTTAPLWRNANFLTLQVGRWTSTLGSQLSTFAYPLLILASTGSAIESGAAVAVRMVPFAFLGPLAGAVADRLDRRRIMLVSDLVRGLVLASLAVLITTQHVWDLYVLVAALCEGCAAVFFNAAQAGLMRAVVPRSQLRAAAGADAARTSTVRLIGPSLGGVLFAVGRAVPFVIDAVTYLVSFLTITRLRIDGSPRKARENEGLLRSVRQGWSYLHGNTVLVTCLLTLSLSSFAIPGNQFLLILTGHQEKLPAEMLGLLVATIGGSALVGASLASFITARTSLRTVLLLELWVCVAGIPFLWWPNPWLVLPSLVLQSALAPVTDAAVMAYVMGNVPDEVLGRVTGTTMTIAAVVTPLGPIVVGTLVAISSPRICMALFITIGVALAVWATTRRNLRNVAWTNAETEMASMS